jgi:hypothetical protein
MILSPKFEKLHQTLTAEIASWPVWMQEALRRDEAYRNSTREYIQLPGTAGGKEHKHG